jgi:hypothetical protein
MIILETSDFHSTGGASIAALRISNSLVSEDNELIRISSDSPNLGCLLSWEGQIFWAIKLNKTDNENIGSVNIFESKRF